MRCNTQAPRRRQENIRCWFGRAHLGVIGGDDKVEQGEPVAVQGGFLAERLARRTGAYGNGNVVGLQMPYQFLCSGHCLRCRKTLAHQRLADHQKLLRRNRQVQRFNHIARQIARAPANDVLFDAPVERPAVTRGNDGGDFGVDAFCVQQQAVHIENHGLDRAECFQWCIHRI
ncbi:hypothetical protein D3C75_319150 [compost metagenome]